MKFEYDVFLSHALTDKPKARELAERLRAAGLRVWFDEWVIQPGDSIPLAIERGLESSRALLLLVTQATFESEWVTIERHTALFRDPTNQHRRFIPVRIDSCDLPSSLTHCHIVDWDDFKIDVLQQSPANRSESVISPDKMSHASAGGHIIAAVAAVAVVAVIAVLLAMSHRPRTSEWTLEDRFEFHEFSQKPKMSATFFVRLRDDDVVPTLIVHNTGPSCLIQDITFLVGEAASVQVDYGLKVVNYSALSGGGKPVTSLDGVAILKSQSYTMIQGRGLGVHFAKIAKLIADRNEESSTISFKIDATTFTIESVAWRLVTLDELDAIAHY